MADVDGAPTEAQRREASLYSTLVLLLATLYALAAVVPDTVRDRSPTLARMLFGFDQLRPLGWFAAILPVLVGVTLRLPWQRAAGSLNTLLDRIAGLRSRRRILLAVVVGAYSFPWFLGLRNQFINPDGMAFSHKFHTEIPVRGASVSHDEILELYVHSRFWYHTNRAFGWTVEYSYQFLSSVAGAIFVVLLLAFAWIGLRPKRWIFLVLGVGCAGFMQLFFGDVENYTLVTLLILGYLFSGYLYLEGRCSLVVPTCVLGVAVTFHLLAAFLLFSLAYLFRVALRRRERRSVALAAVTLVAIPFAVVLYFHHHGLPFGVIRTSNAFGQAGKLQRFAPPSVAYHGQIVSLVFLLFPPVLCLVPLLAFRRVALTPFNAFMALAVVVFMGYVFIWRADLGVYNDWNLYAPAFLPLAIFFWWNFARAQAMVNKAGIAAALILTSAVHSYAWIIRNHV
ncbi:MAG: hypothetical protein M3144_13260 [Actinomycetota bacterium]|nr:hypothetical protein [Actinomycetota bacterium]